MTQVVISYHFDLALVLVGTSGGVEESAPSGRQLVTTFVSANFIIFVKLAPTLAKLG